MSLIFHGGGTGINSKSIIPPPQILVHQLKMSKIYINSGITKLPFLSFGTFMGKKCLNCYISIGEQYIGLFEDYQPWLNLFNLFFVLTILSYSLVTAQNVQTNGTLKVFLKMDTGEIKKNSLP